MKTRLIVLLLLSMSFSAITILPETARGTTLHVGGAGSGNYTTIQGAIDAASPGDTVYVYSGTYYENVVVNKTISLVGEDRNSTIIDGDGTGIVLHISANWANVTDLTATKSGSNRITDAGIRLYIATHCYVANNTVVGNENGILLQSAFYNTIKGNVANGNNKSGIRLRSSQWNNITANALSGNLEGILITDYSQDNTITDNSVAGNVEGIYLVHSYDSTVAFNQVTQNVDAGIRISHSTRNSVAHNEVRNNSHGIELQESSWVAVANNDVSLNRDGISLDSCDNNTISNNTVSSSNWIGIGLWSSEDNWVFHNNLVSNEEQARDFTLRGNYWDSGYPSGGNYWSDYGGTDRKSGSQQDSPGGDGIGDTPYDIKTGIVRYPDHEDTDSRDRYPLMSPFVAPPYIYPNQPPVCGIDNPDVGANVSRRYAIEGSALDHDGIVERVEIRVDGNDWIRAVGTTTWSFNWDSRTVPDGNHVIHARSYDGSEYSVESSVAVNVSNPVHEESIFVQVWFWVTVTVVAAFVAIVLALNRTGWGKRPPQDDPPI